MRFRQLLKLESTSDNKNMNEYKTEIDAIQAIDTGKGFSFGISCLIQLQLMNYLVYIEVFLNRS